MNRNDKYKNLGITTFRIPGDLVKFMLNVYHENCDKLDEHNKGNKQMGPADFAFLCGQMSILEMNLVEMGVLTENEIYQKKTQEDEEDN